MSNTSQEKDKLLPQEDNPYSTFPVDNQNNPKKEEMDSDSEDGSDILSIQKGEKPLRYHFYDQVNKMISTSFGLIAALAWNEAIKALFIQYFGSETAGTTVSLFIYAIMVTLIVIFLVYYIGRLAKIVEDFDRKTSAYMEQQKLKIKQQLKATQAGAKRSSDVVLPAK
mmetsp:Transcript_18465/g.25887  ORF Transcript_18465/g.25887 Transcript_18465/m.25887 type:complete len:168 (+) Transcript_18465:3-506(+)